MKPFQINQLSHLHDGEKIIFCKTDFLLTEFERISDLENDVVLISGNSDYAITDNIVSAAPPNIKKWFAQNAVSNHSVLEPLPIGYENKIVSERGGHGVGYPNRVQLKEELTDFISKNTITKSGRIYANFNTSTNRSHRDPILEICKQNEDITVKSGLTLTEFFHDISDFKMSVCPAGNGIDTHRLWEVLACGGVPITIKIGNFKIYELYNLLPIIQLDYKEQLLDTDLIEEKFAEQKKKNPKDYKPLLEKEYWINRILKESD